MKLADQLLREAKQWTGHGRAARKARKRSGPGEHDSDPKFATMGQVVYGSPPLWTTGVDSCTVIAGHLKSGVSFLMHLDSFDVHYQIYEPYLQRGGDTIPWDRADPATEVWVLAIDTRAQGLKDSIAKLGIPIRSFDQYTVDKPLTVVFDGHALTAKPRD